MPARRNISQTDRLISIQDLRTVRINPLRAYRIDSLISSEGEFEEDPADLNVSCIETVTGDEGNGFGNDSYTVSLLHLNGADQSTTFTDVAVGGTHTWTPHANAKIVTAQSEFGGASALFVVGTKDYIDTPWSTDFDMGTGDHTFDFWVRFNTTPGSGGAMTFVGYMDSSGNDRLSFYLYNNAGTLQLYMLGRVGTVVKAQYHCNWSPNTNTWYHLAFVRNGSTYYFFINGQSQGLTTDTAIGTNSLTPGTGQTMRVSGQLYADTFYMDGWIDEVRISKGIARWVANFIPPARAYNVSGIQTGYVSILLPGIFISVLETLTGSETQTALLNQLLISIFDTLTENDLRTPLLDQLLIQLTEAIDLRISKYSDELITNGGMEIGDPPTGWIGYWSPTIFERSAVQKHSGGYSAHIKNVTPGYGGFYQFSGATIGKTYRVSFWYYQVAGQLACNNQADWSIYLLSTTGQWLYAEKIFTSTIGNDGIFFEGDNSTANQEYYIDDVSVQEVIEADVRVNPLVIQLADAITHADISQPVLSVLLISMIDTITKSDLPQSVLGQLLIQLVDTITTNDLPQSILAELLVQLLDSIVTEDLQPQTLLNELVIQALETITNSDVSQQTVSALIGLFIQMLETLSGSEALRGIINPLIVQATDAIANSDISQEALAQLIISLFETITSSEVPSPPYFLRDLFINILETLILSDVWEKQKQSPPIRPEFLFGRMGKTSPVATAGGNFKFDRNKTISPAQTPGGQFKYKRPKDMN